MNPVTATLATTAGADVFLGNAVTDSADLGGTATQPADPVINLDGTAGDDAGGTITFTLYGPDDCSTVAYTSAPVDVSGDGTYDSPDPQFVPALPGEYHWVAVYSGNLPNTEGVTHNAECDDDDEDVVVNTVPSTLSSAQKWVPNDSVTGDGPCRQWRPGGQRRLRAVRQRDVQRCGHLHAVERGRVGEPRRRRCRRPTPRLSWSVDRSRGESTTTAPTWHSRTLPRRATRRRC